MAGVKEWINNEAQRHVDMAKEFLGLKKIDSHPDLPGVVSDKAEKKATAAEARFKQGPGFGQAIIE